MGDNKGKSKRGSWLRRRARKAVRALRGNFRLQAIGRSQPSEKHRPRDPLELWRPRLEAADPPRHRAVRWIRLADQSLPMAAATLVRALEATAAIGPGMIVSVSHDDYVRSYGGVQNVIGDEERAFRRAGWAYLNISPAAPLPILADPTPATDFRVLLRLNGERLGVSTFADLLTAVTALRASRTTVECVVHHFMGHAPELVLDLIAVTGAMYPVVWTHDFFTLCPSYTLLRNDIAFCGGPALESAACTICCYGTERKHHLARMRTFFEAVRPVVLAPSEVTRDLWLRRSGLRHADSAVVPLARFLTVPLDNVGRISEPGRPLRIAHIGARAFHKGWTVFEELALRLAGDNRFAFFHLGVPEGPALPDNVRNFPVRVDAERRDAMVEAVAEARIDVVVSWSLWPETFCFSAHEALAGGAFVVARAGAGNVWPAIAAKAPNRGCVVADEAALFALFAGDELEARVEASSWRYGALVVVGGAAEWLLRRPRLQPMTPLLVTTAPHAKEMVGHG